MPQEALADALRNATYEILPFPTAEENVLAHVPKDVGLTVTTTEVKGLGVTVDLAARLVRHGYRTAPHLAARLVRDKAHLITQLCFDAATTIRWAREARSRGVDLPIRVGIPGATSRQKLIRVSAGLGLGQSARFLKKKRSMFWRFFLPGGYSPDRLVERLTPAFARSDNELRGFHVFTFNDLAGTEAWRQAWLARLR